MPAIMSGSLAQQGIGPINAEKKVQVHCVAHLHSTYLPFMRKPIFSTPCSPHSHSTHLVVTTFVEREGDLYERGNLEITVVGDDLADGLLHVRIQKLSLCEKTKHLCRPPPNDARVYKERVPVCQSQERKRQRKPITGEEGSARAHHRRGRNNQREPIIGKKQSA